MDSPNPKTMFVLVIAVFTACWANPGFRFLLYPHPKIWQSLIPVYPVPEMYSHTGIVRKLYSVDNKVSPGELPRVRLAEERKIHNPGQQAEAVNPSQ